MTEQQSGVDVHPTAIVEEGAEIGRGSRVWHHAHVRAGARLGSECTVGKNVFIDAGVEIGDRVKIQNNVSIYRGVELEDEVFVGPSAVFTNDMYPRATSPDWKIVPTHVRRGASIGANATILAGADIGSWALVAAGAVVTRAVEANEIVAGNPARRVGWICECTKTVNRTPEDRGDTKCDSCNARV